MVHETRLWTIYSTLIVWLLIQFSRYHSMKMTNTMRNLFMGYLSLYHSVRYWLPLQDTYILNSSINHDEYNYIHCKSSITNCSTHHYFVEIDSDTDQNIQYDMDQSKPGPHAKIFGSTCQNIWVHMQLCFGSTYQNIWINMPEYLGPHARIFGSTCQNIWVHLPGFLGPHGM